MNLSNSSGHWLLISIRVIKKIETEWFQNQNQNLKRNKQAPKQLYLYNYSPQLKEAIANG